jgi:ribonuclease R
MQLERDADDVATCFVLERVLRRDGPGRVFEGEITGLIGAGAFIAFAAPEDLDVDAPQAPPFEGMLPVRLLRVPRPRAAASGAAQRSESTRRRESAARGSGRGGAREGAPEREWWELNEEGTILRGERTGAALRLGDRLRVNVARIDAIRGRVDLEQAG